jgi:DNA-binding transcriptional LysR family regulator
VGNQRVGSHEVVFGSVEDIFIAEHGSPLIYANRAYGTTHYFHRLPAHNGSILSGEMLQLGCYQSFGPYLVPKIIARLIGERPGVQLKIVEGDQHLVLESLRCGDVELALLYDFGLDAEFAVTELAELKPYVLLPDGHPLLARPAIDLQTLAREPMVLLDADPSRGYFQSLFLEHGLQPRVAYRSASFEMVRGLVGHGLGYALLSTKPANNMTYDGRALVIRPLATSVQTSSLVLVTLAERPLSPVGEAFATQCCAEFCT